jgi:hypothetical protein
MTSGSKANVAASPSSRTATFNDDAAETEPSQEHCFGDDSCSHASSADPLSSSFSFDGLSKFPRELARRVDWITQCHNPLEYLQTLGFRSPPKNNKTVHDDVDDHILEYHDDHDDECEADAIGMPFVAFVVPQHCEYCGAESSKDCSPQTCQRPSSFFPKQRPPFCPAPTKSFDTTPSSSFTMKRRQQSYNTAKDDILHMDPWKVAPTPKTKNQWIAPSVVAATDSTNHGSPGTSNDGERFGRGTDKEHERTATRLLFPEVTEPSGRNCSDVASDLPSFSIERRHDTAAADAALLPQVWATH